MAPIDNTGCIILGLIVGVLHVSRSISFTLHTGGYAPLKTDEVAVNPYTRPFHPNRRLGASNPTMETSKSTTARL